MGAVTEAMSDRRVISTYLIACKWGYRNRAKPCCSFVPRVAPADAWKTSDAGTNSENVFCLRRSGERTTVTSSRLATTVKQGLSLVPKDAHTRCPSSLLEV